MSTENEFDFGEQNDFDFGEQPESHPAIDASDFIKTNKRYNTDYSSGDKETLSSIKKKEDRMWDIIGSRSIDTYDTGTRIKQIAEQDPRLYAELMQLTADIQNYYKNQHNGFYNFWKRAGQEFDKGAADSSWNMATRIQSQKNNLFGQRAYLYGLGDDTVQQNATNNAKAFSSNILTAIDTAKPSQLVDILHNIKKYYDYDVKVFDSLPDTDTNKNAILASMARIDSYISAWQKCQSKLEQYRDNPADMKAFLVAYQMKPLTLLSNEERVYINELIKQLSAGQTLHNARSAADLAARVDEKVNSLRGGR